MLMKTISKRNYKTIRISNQQTNLARFLNLIKEGQVLRKAFEVETKSMRIITAHDLKMRSR